MSTPTHPHTGPGAESFNPFSVPARPAAAPKPEAPAQPVPPANPAATGTPPVCASGGVTPVPAEAASTAVEPVDEATRLAARRRKAKYIAVVLVAVTAFAWYVKPWNTATGPSSNQAATTATAVGGDSANASDPLAADLTYAESYLASHGTLDGITIAGAQLAVRDKTMYAVKTIDGVCTVYGLLNGQRIVPTPDNTGAACAGQVVTIQAQLDAAAAQTASSSNWAAEDTLKSASATAVAYASRNFGGGAPSMKGLPASLGGALAVENTGEYVTLRVSYPGACVQAYVTAAGEIGETNTCP